VSYWRNLASAATRFGNALLGGDGRGETMSAATARKAKAGRRLFVVFEAAIDLMFAAIKGERHHCEGQRIKEHGG
jgi:hypothetical protein